MEQTLFINTRFFLILSLIFALLQGPLLPPVFAEGGLFVLFVNNASLPALFASGVIFDLFQNQTLGQTSLIFLAGFVLLAFLRQFFGQKPFLFIAFSLILNIARAKVIFPSLTLFSIFLSWLAATLLIFALFSFLRGFLKLPGRR